MDDREENSEIDVTSGFYVLFGSGKILFMNLMIVEIGIFINHRPPSVKGSTRGCEMNYIYIYIYVCMYVGMYVYNVNISYEAMVFGASFSPFLLSFFIW